MKTLKEEVFNTVLVVVMLLIQIYFCKQKLALLVWNSAHLYTHSSIHSPSGRSDAILILCQTELSSHMFNCMGM